MRINLEGHKMASSRLIVLLISMSMVRAAKGGRRGDLAQGLGGIGNLIKEEF